MLAVIVDVDHLRGPYRLGAIPSCQVLLYSQSWPMDQVLLVRRARSNSDKSSSKSTGRHGLFCSGMSLCWDLTSMRESVALGRTDVSEDASVEWETASLTIAAS